MGMKRSGGGGGFFCGTDLKVNDGKRSKEPSVPKTGEGRSNQIKKTKKNNGEEKESFLQENR